MTPGTQALGGSPSPTVPFPLLPGSGVPVPAVRIRRDVECGGIPVLAQNPAGATSQQCPFPDPVIKGIQIQMGPRTPSGQPSPAAFRLYLPVRGSAVARRCLRLACGTHPELVPAPLNKVWPRQRRCLVVRWGRGEWRVSPVCHETY